MTAFGGPQGKRPDGASASPQATAFVFLGPSLPLTEAKKILDAQYLPPASMGDVYRLLRRLQDAGPRPLDSIAIAIVDGLFEQTPAVWHKEILFALSQGIRVLGASSMGALRAAELAAFGMEGVGEVFEAFHRGELEDDDEVAVAHAPAADGYRSLSDAMVSIRAGLREARAEGLVSGETHDRLVGAAKKLFYPDRSWPRLLEAAGELGIPIGEVVALRGLVAKRRPDVKRADAIRLLRQLAAEQAAAAPAIPPALPRFDFEPTWFWEQMILHEEDTALLGSAPDVGREPDGAVSLAALKRHVRLHPGRARDALGAALLMYLADEQAGRRGLDPAAGATKATMTATTPVATAPEAERLPPEDRALLERGQTAVDALLRAVADQVNRRLPAALAQLGRLGPTLTDVRRKQAILRSLGLRAASPTDAGITLDELLGWYERRFSPLAGASPEAHAEQAGFASVEEFVGEVALEYLVEKGR